MSVSGGISRSDPVLFPCDFIAYLCTRRRPFFGVNFYIMAIISSMGVGRARKSMGNVTYRTVRGRTIGSQKRVATGGAATRGEGQILSRQQALFGMVSMFMQAHGSDIDVSFNKTKYGSQRNGFFKKNRAALFAALAALANTAISQGYPTLEEVEAAITAYATANPTSIVRVSLQGFDVVYLSGAWSSDDNPVSGGSSTNDIGTGEVVSNADAYKYSAPCATSMAFRAGAKIVRPATNTLINCAGLPAGVTPANIQFLTAGGAPVSGLTVTSVTTSVAGSIRYEAPEITEAQNVLGVLIGGVYVRLTSAYVRTSDDNPLG